MSHDNHPSSSSSQNAPNTWTEPPWSGWIETTGDALLILEAARRGLIPRVTRRLVDSERKMITSGSVFVFDEDESGIKRWTDGFFWSPSRILGNFLLYRETEKRGAGHRSARADREVVNEQYIPPESVKVEAGQSLSRPKSETNRLGIDRQRERSLVGSLTNSYKFKPGGMMKKTFSLTIGGVAQHLISYYKVEDVEQGRLRSPSTLPELASLDISPEYLDKTHFRNPPKVEIGVDGVPRYRGEADDIESSPSLLTTPLALPSYDEPSSSKRPSSKRYDPYASSSSSTAMARRPRKTKSVSQSRSQDTDDSGSPTATAYSAPPPPVQPTASYPETSLSGTTTVPYSSYGYYHPYHVPSAYSTSPYPPPPASPVTAPPQQTPTPPHQAPPASVTYPGYTSTAESPGSHSQSQSQPAPAPYPSYYAPPPPPAPHGYGSYPGIWPQPQYPGYATQSNERVQKKEKDDAV